MPWNSNTKIMTGPLNLLSKNGSYGDIQQATRCDSPDLGDCIVNGHINKWSLIKPVRFNKIAPLTSTDFADANYGFRIAPVVEGNSTLPGIYADNLEDVFDNALYYEGDWPYDRPRGASYNEHFRYSDFIGYHGIGNAEAKCPVASSIYAMTGEGYCPFTVQNDTSAEIELDMLSYNAPGIEDFDFANSNLFFLYKMRGGSVYYVDKTNKTFSELQFQPVTSDIYLTLPGKTDQIYDVIAAISSWDGTPVHHQHEGTPDDEVWVFLPNTLQSITVKKQYGTLLLYLYEDPTTHYANSFKVTRTVGTDTCRVDIKLVIGNELRSQANISSLSVEATLYDDTFSELGRTTVTHSALNYGEYDIISFSVENSTDYVPTAATLDDLYFDMTVYYKINNVSQTAKYFDFMNDCGTENTVDKETLADIRTYYNIQ